MRMSATKLVGVLALGGALFTSTACGPLESITGGGSKDEACGNIKTEFESFTEGSSSLTGDPAAAVQKFSSLASTVRTEGQNAGGDVESAATALADDMDKFADSLEQMSSGNLSGGMPDMSSMQQNAKDLGEACGFSGGINLIG